MQEQNLIRQIEAFPLVEFLSMARECGRLGIDPTLRADAAKLYETIRGFRADVWFVSEQAAASLDLAERFLYGEWFIAEHGFANYPSYIGLAMVKYFLGVHLREDFRRGWQKCKACMHILLNDVLSYEVSSLAGILPWYPNNRVLGVMRDRIAALNKLRTSFAALTHGPMPIVPSHILSWTEYAEKGQEHLILGHLTALSVSCEHDEYFFMRVLQMSECCYWGALTAVIAAIESTKIACLEDAMAHMEQALSFINLLHPITKVLKTMPPEHFWAFRDATDGSSAIQSRWFHLLQIYIYGLDERKISIYAGIPEICDLMHYGKPGFVSLRSLLRDFAERPPAEFDAFAEVAMRLDASLYAYRCIHLGIVHRFLPPDAKQGTGGSSGIPYLRKHLTRRLWPLEKEYPQPDLKELNAIDMFHPLVGVGN